MTEGSSIRSTTKRKCKYGFFQILFSVPGGLIELYLLSRVLFPTRLLDNDRNRNFPENDFTLRSGDTVKMSIDGIGTLENQVE